MNMAILDVMTNWVLALLGRLIQEALYICIYFVVNLYLFVLN